MKKQLKEKDDKIVFLEKIIEEKSREHISTEDKEQQTDMEQSLNTKEDQKDFIEHEDKSNDRVENVMNQGSSLTCVR